MSKSSWPGRWNPTFLTRDQATDCPLATFGALKQRAAETDKKDGQRKRGQLKRYWMPKPSVQRVNHLSGGHFDDRDIAARFKMKAYCLAEIGESIEIFTAHRFAHVGLRYQVRLACFLIDNAIRG